MSGVLLLVSVRAKAPKQAQITFDSNRDGNYEIYVMDADGRNPRRLTNNPAVDAAPDWFDSAFAYAYAYAYAYAVSSAFKLRGTWGWLKQTSR